MLLTLERERLRTELVQAVKDISSQKIMACYQCGKCTAGCPLADKMDFVPNQVIRMVMLGEVEELLGSTTIWLCTSCFQCGTRCPKNIDVSRIMEALRTICTREGRNRTDLQELPKEQMDEMPQQAIIAGFRKFESLA